MTNESQEPAAGHVESGHAGHFVAEFAVLVLSVIFMAPAVISGTSPISKKLEAIDYVPHPEYIVTVFLSLYALRFWLGWQLTEQDPAFKAAAGGGAPKGIGQGAFHLFCGYAAAPLLGAGVGGKIGFAGLLAVLLVHCALLAAINYHYWPAISKSDERGPVYIFILIGDIASIAFLMAVCFFLMVGWEAQSSSALREIELAVVRYGAATFLFLFGCALPVFLGEAWLHYYPTVKTRIATLLKQHN